MFLMRLWLYKIQTLTHMNHFTKNIYMFICHVSVRVSDWLVVSHVIEEALWLRWRVLLTNHDPWTLKQETVQNIKQLAVIVFKSLTD